MEIGRRIVRAVDLILIPRALGIEPEKLFHRVMRGSDVGVGGGSRGPPGTAVAVRRDMGALEPGEIERAHRRGSYGS